MSMEPDPMSGAAAPGPGLAGARPAPHAQPIPRHGSAINVPHARMHLGHSGGSFGSLTRMLGISPRISGAEMHFSPQLYTGMSISPAFPFLDPPANSPKLQFRNPRPESPTEEPIDVVTDSGWSEESLIPTIGFAGTGEELSFEDPIGAPFPEEDELASIFDNSHLGQDPDKRALIGGGSDAMWNSHARDDAQGGQQPSAAHPGVHSMASRSPLSGASPPPPELIPGFDYIPLFDVGASASLSAAHMGAGIPPSSSLAAASKAAGGRGVQSKPPSAAASASASPVGAQSRTRAAANAACGPGASSRDIHNAMERERRVNLRRCFEDLRVVIPGLTDNRAPSLQILNHAAAYIAQLKEEEAHLVREKSSLLAENKAIRHQLERAGVEPAVGVIPHITPP